MNQTSWANTMRTKIALRNLYISQTIIIAFLIFAYFVWFPHSFSDLGGFYKTAFMLIFADIILGPLLVFIVFKEGKKYLKFDINVLLSIQIGAFIFGAYSLYLKHPAYAVFHNNQFVLTNVSHIYPQPSWQEQLKTTIFSSPKLVMTNLNSDDLSAMSIEIEMFGGAAIESRTALFSAIKNNALFSFDNSIKVDDLLASQSAKNKLTLFLNSKGGTAKDYAYLPLSGNNKQKVIWVFDRNSKRPVGILDIDPTKLSQLASN